MSIYIIVCMCKCTNNSNMHYIQANVGSGWISDAIVLSFSYLALELALELEPLVGGSKGVLPVLQSQPR